MLRHKDRPPPFVILGTPRSRTAWLAELLTFNGWKCWHEPSVGFRRIDDLYRLLERNRVGAADSMMTFLYPQIMRANPNTRVVVVRRPLDEVVTSFLAITALSNQQKRLIAMADEAAAKIADEDDVLSVQFASLAGNDVCQEIVAHTIGGTMPLERLQAFQETNVQQDYIETLSHVAANRAGIRRVFGQFIAKSEEAR